MGGPGAAAGGPLSCSFHHQLQPESREWSPEAKLSALELHRHSPSGGGGGGWHGGATGSLPCKGMGEVAASTGALQPQARAPGEDSDMPAPTTPLHPGSPAFRAGKDPPSGSPNISHDMHLLLSCRSAQQPMTQPNPAGSTVPTHGGLQLSIFPPPATTSALGHHRAALDSSPVRAQTCFEELPN